ncbi:MAG: FAD-binding oxidoreductase [Candidatus Aminicenantes bacterium]|nr:FAD-binding oxidoreductase [Candidatus Aminicenantes bacterium]
MAQMIIGILVIAGIGTILALLLELADTFIADYGPCQLNINNKKDVEVKGGNPLLFSLAEQGIFIPSACGGKGTCAYCKVKVLEGGGPVLPTEIPFLSDQEMEDNVRLSCQVKVRNDLAIEIPEELFLIQEFKVRVKNIKDLTLQVKSLNLEILSQKEIISFKPGQYIQLEVPKFKLSKVPEFRAFSMANSPQEQPNIELFVGRVKKGIVSTYIHDYLKAGEEVNVRGPFGDFFYRDSNRNIMMIATGTGLAPIMSILRFFKSKHIQRKTTLFFGTRKKEDLYCMDELRDLEKQLTDFKFIPILSREPEESSWKGERGRVTDLIENAVKESADIDVYICGNADMVESSSDLLKKKGIPQNQIYFDKFT